MSKDLAVTRIEFPETVTFSVNEVAINAMKEKFPIIEDEAIRDLSVPENAARSLDANRTYRQATRSITEDHKYIKGPALKFSQMVDGTKRDALSSFEAEKVFWKKVHTDWKEKEELAKREAERLEEERVDNINASINEMRDMVRDSVDCTSEELAVNLAFLEKRDVGEWAEEYTEAALAVHTETLAALESLQVKAVAFEEVQVRMAKETEEREEAALVELEKRKAEEQAAAAAQAEKDRLAATELKKHQDELAAAQAEVEAERARNRKEHEEAMAKLQAAEAEKRKKAEEDARVIRERQEREEAARKAKEALAMESEYTAEARVDILQIMQSSTFSADNDQKIYASAIVDAIKDGNVRHIAWV